MGVRERIAAVVSAEDATNGKPDPEGYLLALDALRSAVGEDLEAAHCLVFEDSLAGIQSAKGAGMWAVGVSNTYGEAALRAAGADAVHPRPAKRSMRAGSSRCSRPRSRRDARCRSSPDGPAGLLLSRDLIFTTKVTGHGAGPGPEGRHGRRHRARFRRCLPNGSPTVVFVDLAAGDLVAPTALIAYRRNRPGTPFVAFGSHVDAERAPGRPRRRLRRGHAPIAVRRRTSRAAPPLSRRASGIE